MRRLAWLYGWAWLCTVGVLATAATVLPWALRPNRHERLPGEFTED